jgi:predicted deacylase
VSGRDLVAFHRVGSSTPTRRVVVVGTVHGEEPAGVQVVDALRATVLPADLDLWLVPTGNPDGLAVGRRTNDHGVDLNRNFPQNWAPNGTPSDISSHYSGPSAGSEPETQAMMAFLAAVHPDTTVWYHQPLETVDCNLARDAALAARCTRYAAAVGLPVNTPTGRPPGFMVFSGTATDWQMSHGLGGAFVVEFTVGIGPITVARHVAAVLTALV